MSRIITVDIGNSSIAVAVLNNLQSEFSGRIATMRDYTEKEITKAFCGLLSDYIDEDDPDFVRNYFDGSILSSVVPEINEVTLLAMETITGKKPVLMNHDLNTGINLSLYDDGKIGTDRIVDLAAAKMMFKDRPVMVCDLGTCTTITVADGKGILLGGMIAPGIQLSLDAQAQRTAQLPQLVAKDVINILGKDTETNMMSGAVAGAGLMISGAYKRIAKDYGLNNMALVITGGNAGYVLPWIEEEVFYEKGLLFKGLYLIYELNSQTEEIGAKYAIRKKCSIRSYRGNRGLQVG